MSYLAFNEIINPGKKTKAWVVYSTQGQVYLGSVRWMNTWRKYTFSPVADTVFDPSCLREIADFTETKTTEHRS